MKDKIKQIGIIILTMIVMMLIFLSIVGLGNFFQHNNQKMLGNLIMFLFPVVTFIGVKKFNKSYNKLNANEYGFNFKKLGKSVLLGITLPFLIILTSLLFAKLLYDVPFTFTKIKPDFINPLVSLSLTLIIVGVWEEFYFRGLVYTTLLRNKFGFHSSSLISSILFSIIHWSSFDMQETSWLWYIGIVFLGYILVYIYTITNSIWAVVSFHFAWNFIASLLDDKENEIGLFEIPNYFKYSKLTDNFMVITLGFILLSFILISKKMSMLKHLEAK